MSPRPLISVLLPAHNAARFVRRSVESVLAQTCEDFELIVVDDGSTDATASIVRSIPDPRIILVSNERNLGIVSSLNRAFAAARGMYIARIDADDLCQPTRFAHQHKLLQTQPEVVLCGTSMSVLRDGVVQFTRPAADPDPVLLRWMLHIGNPIGHPSMMFRADAARSLGDYLRQDYIYAEDFDFSHRMMRLGELRIIPDHLVIYRSHEDNATRRRRQQMIAAVARVLRQAYQDLLGVPCELDSDLVARHLTAAEPFESGEEIERLAEFLTVLCARFAEVHALSPAQVQGMHRHTARAWWDSMRATLGAGRGVLVARHWRALPVGRSVRPPFARFARAAASGVLRGERVPAASATGRRLSHPEARLPAPTISLCDTRFTELLPTRDDCPTLYVVVDTEAEFDWERRHYSPSQTGVATMAEQVRAQAIFEPFGVRPIYLVDFAVASQPAGYRPLREIMNRHACVVGAHLHSWVNPPFEEAVSESTSFQGNLSPALEERKLRCLRDEIERRFGIRPLFFKAGRYGIGRATMESLAQLGFAVDFSIMPMVDLRAKGGPDLRNARSVPYRVACSQLVSVPMTRGQYGALGPLPDTLYRVLHSRAGRSLHAPGVLSRLNLARTATLTPEGVSAKEQISLIRALAAQGTRTFVLHYHSPSLGMRTPYATNEAERDELLARVERVCRFFFGTFGGLAGNPADLLPTHLRPLLWPNRNWRADEPAP